MIKLTKIRYELIAKEMGEHAYKSGRPRAPILNRDIVEFSKEAQAHSSQVDIFKSFLIGWDLANLYDTNNINLTGANHA